MYIYSLSDESLGMDSALNNNLSWLKFVLSSLSDVGEPVLNLLTHLVHLFAHLVPRVSRTGHPCVSTFDEPFLTR